MAIASLLTSVVNKRWNAKDRGIKEVVVNTATTNRTAADVLVLFSFDEDVVVEKLEMIVKTAEGGTLTVDVGDYSDAGTTAVDADGFLDGASGNATAGTLASSTVIAGDPGAYTSAYAQGRYLAGATATKYICALINNDADAAILLFRVYYNHVNA